jgi:EAL and modified HD-GYP domain-containing signal transduction protein
VADSDDLASGKPAALGADDAAFGDVLATRRPVWDSRGIVRAYDIVADNSDHDTVSPTGRDELARRTIHVIASVTGPFVIGPGTSLFVRVTLDTLGRRHYLALPKDRVVLIVDASSSICELVKECAEANLRGYSIALEADQWEQGAAIQRSAAYVRASSFDTLPGIVHHAHVSGQRVVALGVHDRSRWDLANRAGCDLCAGDALCIADIDEAREVRGFELVFMNLLAELAEPVLDRKAVASVIESDLALAHGLLRRVNAAASGVRQRVSSIPQALALLGDEQARAWGCLIAMSGLKGPNPAELVTASLVRARFSFRLAGMCGLADRACEAYMVGLLSMLDAILGIPMERALDEIGISGDARVALLGDQTGALGQLLTLSHACEKGAWSTVQGARSKLGLAQRTIAREYYEALAWVQRLLQQSNDQG